MVRRLGATIVTGAELGGNLDWNALRRDFDMVFLSVGLGATPCLAIPGEELVLDGLEYIEQSKMDPANMQVGSNVVVIGAGNTAIDCATVARRQGAKQVTMVYRRTEREMTAYQHEYDFVKLEGVEVRFLTQPVRVVAESGRVAGLECRRVELGAPDASGRAAPVEVPGSESVIPADQVVKAIGQQKPRLAALLGLKTAKGFIEVDQNFQTSLPAVYAGGDCIRARGAASTVMAVQDGKLAAQAMHRAMDDIATQQGVSNRG
jgi:dihydropyrimidine dehydrogenase (NAD+) subunit PreT